MPSRLLNLPPELLEHALILLCHEHAPSIQSCRQTCHTLHTIIAHSQLVQYLERVALQGMYDPASAKTLALPERAAALRTWESAWGALAGPFWKARAPYKCIALPPPWPSLSPSRVRYISAKIVDPDPELPVLGLVLEGDGQHGMLDEEDHFSFGPWFIAGTRDGINVRASYSYFDLHGCLGGGVGGKGEGEGEAAVPGGRQSGDVKDGDDRSADHDYAYWTVVKVPVWNVVAFALSTELDLAVVISTAKIESQDEEDEERRTRTHLAVRPLRFRDGTPHPCAKVPTMRFSVTSASAVCISQGQVLGDYILLWIWPGEDDYSLSKLYLIAWKEGSITLLRENPAGKYGSVPAMISNDVLALVQVDPPGIELCRLSNIQKEAEAEGSDGGDSGGGTTHGRGSRSDGPRMDKLCTLLLPPLRERRDGADGAAATGARRAHINWAFCAGEHPGHPTFSRGPWPEYRRAPLGRRRVFRQSTKESIVSVVMEITGCNGHVRTFEVIVRSSTLLAYAQAQVVVVLPWDAWGPQATAMSDHTHVGWRYLLGERRATLEEGGHQIRIRDYNPYRIRQARASLVARGSGDSHEEEGGQDEGEESADTFRPNGTRRITERSMIRGGEWFQEDVVTALPHTDTVLDVPGCRAIYMEQDQILLRVDDLDQITGRPSMMNGGLRRYVEGFVLYSM